MPYHLAHKKVAVEVNEHSLQVYHQSLQVAEHSRSETPMERTQKLVHLKPEHLAEQNKNKAVYIKWAHDISDDTERFIDKQYTQTRNPHSRAIGVTTKSKTSLP